jgi:carbohydrate diacid regulator
MIDSIVSFFHLPDDTICAYIGAGELVVLKASSTEDLRAWADEESASEPPSASWANLDPLKRAGEALLVRLRRDTNAVVNVGIGRYHPGLRGLARSYGDARAALRLGRRVSGNNRVHCLDSIGVAAFVGIDDEQTKIGLARHLLSPLEEAPGLLGTLEAFFAEDCCPSAAAARLAIHRNTLTYRLDRIASLTALDPRHFDDAVQIRLALAVRSLQDGNGPRPI